MAHLRKGILGGFSGKVGPVVGASWRGIDVMRSLPKKSKREATEEQLIQRVKFGLVARFLAPVKPLLKDFYGVNSGYKSKANLAMSYHIREAVTGDYPDYSIDYPRVILSRGELLGPQEAEVIGLPNARLDFNWTDNSGQGEAKANDALIVVVYEESTNTFEYLQQGAKRSETTFTMTLPAYYTGLKVQCWITFASADGKRVANSIYMGEILVG